MLDDLQWADGATWAAVRSLTAGLRHRGILWVLACYSDATSAVRDVWERLVSEGAQRWELAPLPPRTTAAITADLAGAPADQSLLALTEQAMGNPLVLLELLRGLQEENRLTITGGRATVAGAGLPRRLTESMNHRIGRLGAQTRAMMRMAALLPPQFTAAQLAGMLQCRPSELVEAFGETVRADLIVEDAGQLRFRSALLRQAVRESLPASLRRALECQADMQLNSTATAGRPVVPRLSDSQETLDPGGTEPARARHQAWLTDSRWMGADLDAVQHALLAAQVAGDDDARASALLVLGGIHVGHGSGGRASERLDEVLRLIAERDGVGEHLPSWNLQSANLLHCLGRSNESAAAMTEALLGAQRLRDNDMLIMWTRLSGMFKLASGRLPDAQVQAEMIPLTDDEFDNRTVGGVVCMITYAGLARHTGDTGLAAEAAASARRMRHAGSPVARLWANRVLATSTAPQQAIALIEEDPLLPATSPFPADHDFLVFAADLAVTTADPDLTARARAAANRLVQDDAAPTLFSGVAALVHGLLDRDTDGLELAARLLRAVSRPLLSASALEHAGHIRADQGQWGAAGSRWRTAQETFAACHATADVERLTAVLRERGAIRRPGGSRPPFGWASLTETERRVVRLVVGGASNREAARRLFLSPHTVNTHVRHVYAKLDINSRVQLTNLAHSFGD